MQHILIQRIPPNILKKCTNSSSWMSFHLLKAMKSNISKTLFAKITNISHTKMNCRSEIVSHLARLMFFKFQNTTCRLKISHYADLALWVTKNNKKTYVSTRVIDHITHTSLYPASSEIQVHRQWSKLWSQRSK